MPQNALQIALEHHRAGRVQKAEAGYRGILASDPGDAETMHWLGVLTFQAAQFKEAIFWLEQAAAMRPQEAAFQHNLAQAYLGAGQEDGAIKAFERAVAADPKQAEPLVSLALARMSRGLPGDAEAAVVALRQAHANGLDTADLHHQLGIALLAAGQPGESIAACRASLEKQPENPRTYYHLALAHRGMRDAQEVRKCLIKALEIDPGMAEGWCGLATLDAEAGRMIEAAALYRRAIAAKRDYPAAYQGLGRVLQESGKREDALAAFAQAVRASRGKAGTPSPAAAPKTSSPTNPMAALERKLTPTVKGAQFHYALAALKSVFPPSQVPPEAISGLFDKYASYFDDHLVGQLGYRVPEMIGRAVAEAWEGKPVDVLDLGCGTGLCGPLVRPMARKLVGVDLSPLMIEKARERAVYDRLEIDELVAATRKEPLAYDLLIAADVLIYLGDLFPVFEAATSALRPGGQLAFSVEAGGGERYNLIQKSRRYTHSKPYLQKLAGMLGFEELRFEPMVARMENDVPVVGHLIVLRWPG